MTRREGVLGIFGKGRANPSYLLSRRLSRIYSFLVNFAKWRGWMENLAALGWTFDGAATNYTRTPAGKDVTGTRREEAGERAYSGGRLRLSAPCLL